MDERDPEILKHKYIHLGFHIRHVRNYETRLARVFSSISSAQFYYNTTLSSFLICKFHAQHSYLGVVLTGLTFLCDGQICRFATCDPNLARLGYVSGHRFFQDL